MVTVATFVSAVLGAVVWAGGALGVAVVTGALAGSIGVLLHAASTAALKAHRASLSIANSFLDRDQDRAVTR
jgi:hypothetical protein